jgi:hypothetical protein
MARTEWPTVGLCLLAVVLFATSARLAAFAEEAPAKGTSATSDHQRAPDNKGPPAQDGKGGSGDHATGEGPTGTHQTGAANAISHEPTGHEADPIDTSIGVEPRRPANRRDDGNGARTKLKSFIHSDDRPHGLTHGPSGVVRNAIGVAVTPHHDFGRHEYHPVAPIFHAPVAPLGAAPGAGPGVPKVSSAPEPSRLLHPGPPPGAPTPLARQGTISGTDLTHKGSGPARIGGPAKTLAGISGTTIKTKR